MAHSTEFSPQVQAVQKIAAIPSILEVVCQLTGMGFAAVAHVTEEKWVACAVLDRVGFGLKPGGELPLKSTLCDEIRASRCEIVIDHVSLDPVYANHHTPRTYGLESYISIPVVLGDGRFFGTLCAISARPAKLKDTAIVDMFRLFAQLIARNLDDQLLLSQSQTALAESIEAAQLREEFIAVLGHDLRNPLASLHAGIRLLQRRPQSEEGSAILRQLKDATTRMTKLVENMLDFARGRLGGGIDAQMHEQTVCPILERVLAEARSTHPARDIRYTCEPGLLARVDESRIGQMFSNLLGNALTHGAANRPVVIDAVAKGDSLEISVANGGPPIPAEAQARLFLPFYRGDGVSKKGGLGLGLYIASQIAVAHGGRLSVESDPRQTRFTFRMPLCPAGASDQGAAA
jgi:signal transduction histidine kinase